RCARGRRAPRPHPLARTGDPAPDGGRRLRPAARRPHARRSGPGTGIRRSGDQLRPGPADGPWPAPLARLTGLAARVGRAGYPPDRAGTVRLPAGGVAADAHPALTARDTRVWARDAVG